MSVWSRASELLARLAAAGKGFLDTPDWLRKETDRQVRFTIAVIALGAKLAKVDGTVTVNEVRVFREIFRIDRADERHAARVYNYARQSSAGYESYGRAVARLFPNNRRILGGVLDGLFHVAVADGNLKPAEVEFLHRLNELFGFSDEHFEGMLCRFSGDSAENPYKVLGVDPDAPIEDVQRRWRDLVRQNHPDVLVAEGMPHEAIKLAERRLAAYNDAWAMIRDMHRN